MVKNRLLISLIILIISLSIAISPISMSSAFATTDTIADINKIYVGKHDSSSQVMRRELGTCSQVYSKGWCNSHGFKNNRPVPGRVTLTEKEKKCLYELYSEGYPAWIAASLEFGVAGAVFAGPAAAFHLYNCLK